MKLGPQKSLVKAKVPQTFTGFLRHYQNIYIYIYLRAFFKWHRLPKINIAPEIIASQKERLVFEASFFRGYVYIKLPGWLWDFWQSAQAVQGSTSLRSLDQVMVWCPPEMTPTKMTRFLGAFSMDFVTQLLKWQYRGHSINNPNNAQPKKGNPFDFPQPGNLMTPKQYGNLQKFKLRFSLPYMPKHDQKKQIFAENKALQMSERLHWDFFSAHCYWSKMQYAHRKTLNLSGVW